MATALIDSRRLTGPNLFSTRPGAVLEVAVDPAHAGVVERRWREAVRLLLDALGWPDEEVVTRAWPGGLGLFVTAPLDGLLAATEVTEQALALAEEPPSGTPGPVPVPHDLLARLRVHIQHDRHPRLVALAAAAAERGHVFTFDDDVVAVGGGTGVLVWPAHALPAADDVDWARVHDVPIALLTGSNGKTTTTRLVADMLRAAGRHVGHTCTDGIYLDGERLAAGDWSGPAGARQVLRDARVTAAVLETARGGLLRRGVAPSLADVAVVTRIAADHFGEYGIHDERSLGEAKLVLARALRPGAPLVLNADDNTLVTLASALPAATPVAWFSLDARNAVVRATATAGGMAAVLDDGRLMLCHAGENRAIAHVDDVPITLGGDARHNVANALAALLAATALGVPASAIATSLRRFGTAASDNPGRLQVRSVGGATVIVDFVHNPDGWRAMLDLAARRRTGRLIVTLGQAGDRNDADLDAMAQVVWGARPDLIVLKEMEEYLRGRPYGQVTELLSAALHRAGTPEDRLHIAPDELGASRRALQAARPGDVVIIAAHAAYDQVLQMVDQAME